MLLAKVGKDKEEPGAWESTLKYIMRKRRANVTHSYGMIFDG